MKSESLLGAECSCNFVKVLVLVEEEIVETFSEEPGFTWRGLVKF